MHHDLAGWHEHEREHERDFELVFAEAEANEVETTRHAVRSVAVVNVGGHWLLPIAPAADRVAVSVEVDRPALDDVVLTATESATRDQLEGEDDVRLALRSDLLPAFSQ